MENRIQTVIDNLDSELVTLMEIEDSNQNQALENLLITYRYRHDLIHHSFVIMADLPDMLRVERRAGFYFKDLPDNLSKLTPDLIVMFDGDLQITQDADNARFIKIVDFSISTRTNQQIDAKRRKYEPLTAEIQKIYPAADVGLHVSFVSPRLEDVEQRFEDFCSFLSIEGGERVSMLSLRFFSDKINVTQLNLRKKIQDERLVHQYFAKEFGDTDEETIGLEGSVDDDLFERINRLYLNNLQNCNRNQVLRRHAEEIMVKCEKLSNLSDSERQSHYDKKFLAKCEILKQLVEDNDVVEALSEKKTSINAIQNSIDILYEKNKNYPESHSKPIHQLFTPILSSQPIDLEYDTALDNDLLKELRLEQKQILLMLSLFRNSGSHGLATDFVSEISKEVIDSFKGEHRKFNISMFNKGVYLNDETDKLYRKLYDNYKEECKENKTPISSYLEFLKQKKEFVPKQNDTRSYRQKMFKIPLTNRSSEFTEFWKKSHSGYKKEKKVPTKERPTCGFDQSEEIDDILDLFSEKIKPGLVNKDYYSSILGRLDSDDEPVLKDLKEKMTKEYLPILQELRCYKGYKYIQTQSLIAEQIMHFNQFSLPSNTMSFFTAGTPNLLYILNNSYHDKGKDVGKAFMVIGYTDDNRWFTRPFGKITSWNSTINGKKVIMFCTNWRRIETYKVTFLKDQYFCILSTAMNGLLRNRTNILDYDRIEGSDEYSREIVRHHFSLKVLIGLTTNQRIAEMLADMRYAIMASFSEFSEIERLIVDKFSPPYNTSMEVWIANRMHNLKKQATDFVESDIRNIYFKQPVFYNGKRSEDSIGGRFDIPSIWTSLIIHDLQDLLDDMFIYVHTLKEPSSIHHENVKAINTILEYQQKYEEMNSDRKCGVGNFELIKEMLLDKKSNIGHNSEILDVSVQRTMNSLKGMNWDEVFKKHFNEPISNITSTKAAIPEYERELVDVSEEKKKKKKVKKTKMPSLYIQEYAKYNNIETKLRPLKMLRTKISKESSLPNKNRSKVHDCILDVLEQNNYITTVFDMAEWNVNKNRSKTLADICIKAQYGAKREFYVINVGSKACARVLENMFEEICKQLPNEMISVPGDKKLLVMQDFINAALSRKGSTDRVYFVNGDCTKWSAAETMECFASMLKGLSGHCNIGFIKYMMSVVLMWGNKDITIPISLLQNTFFITNEYTKYMETHAATLNSDQNFLQGMFNYMSSFKAVCSSNFARDVWLKIYPDSKLRVEHMEHSDDYSMIVTIQDEEELIRFRTLHRMVMKCHGFNDSTKKTNTQQFLMEFISLVSLNGHMTYPHIKKLKECGMNLGCTGYRDDMDSAMSRVGESVRVGSVMTSSYFMQRCHIANVCRSYSLLDGQRNNFMTIKQMANTPVELFGIPDIHPILSFLCKGMANNYRLLRHSSKRENHFILDNEEFTVSNELLLRNLLELEKTEVDNKDAISEVNFTEGIRFFHPRYSFDMENKLIKKIRSNVKMTFEESIEFWDKHKSYNFVKPKNRHLLLAWMRAIYFRHSFAMAYSRNSRAQITLRLSTYTSKDCCVIGVNEFLIPVQVTIKEYVRRFFRNELIMKHKNKSIITDVERKELIKASMNCDATVSSIYSFYSESRIIEHGTHTRSTIATLTPTKINWLNIDNSPSSLIQYIFNYDDFIKDTRYHKGLSSLNSDRKVIEKFYGEEFSENTKLSTVKSVFTDMNLSQNRRNLCMSYSNTINTLEEFLSNHTEFGSFYQKRFQVVSAGVKDAMNPHTGEIYFKKMRTTTKNPYKAMIDDAALLYSMVRHSYSKPIKEVKEILNRLKINDPNSSDNVSYSFADLMTKNVTDIKSYGFNHNEMKTFCFLKAFMTDNSKELSEIVNEKLVYTYQYDTLSGFLSEIFSESVRYDYQNVKFRAMKFKGSKQIIVLTDTPQKHLLTDAFLIGQKLFNIIKQSELEKNVSQTPLRSIMDNPTLNSADEIMSDSAFSQFKEQMNIYNALSKEGEQSFYMFRDANTEKYNRMIFFSVLDIDGLYSSQDERINKQISIDWDQSSVYVGSKKMFTLPVLGCVQSNCSYLEDDIELNGLSANWWLNESRIRHFIHEEDIPTTRQIYDELGSYLLENDNYLFALSCCNKLESLKDIPAVKMFLSNYNIVDNLRERIRKKKFNCKESAPEFVLPSDNDNGGNDILSEEETEEEQKLYSSDDDIPDDFIEDEFGELSEEQLKKLMEGEMDMEFEGFNVIEDEEDSDIEDFEQEKIRNDDSTGSSKSDPQYLKFHEFRNMVPKISTADIIFTSGKSHSTQRLRRLGDPTHYIVKKGYADRSAVFTAKVKDKVGMLYKLKTILSLADYINDNELLLAVTLLSEILYSFNTRDEWTIREDFVLYKNVDDDYDIFLKYTGAVSESGKISICKKGGHYIRTPDTDYVLIPIPEDKKRQLLDSISDDMEISKFLNVKPLENCYKRLFKEPFRRIGFASQLLAEFL